MSTSFSKEWSIPSILFLYFQWYQASHSGIVYDVPSLAIPIHQGSWYKSHGNFALSCLVIWLILWKGPKCWKRFSLCNSNYMGWDKFFTRLNLKSPERKFVMWAPSERKLPRTTPSWVSHINIHETRCFNSRPRLFVISHLGARLNHRCDFNENGLFLKFLYSEFWQ